MSSARHQKVLAQERARHAGYLRMQQHLARKVVPADKAVGVAAGLIETAPIKVVLYEALKHDVARGDKIHHAVVIQRGLYIRHALSPSTIFSNMNSNPT